MCNKKISLFLFLILYLPTLFSWPVGDPNKSTNIMPIVTSEEEFKMLSPEEKVDTILKDYNGYTWFYFKRDFLTKADMIYTEREKTLPYMMLILQQYEAHPIGSEQTEIQLIDNIIHFTSFRVEEFSKSELKELSEIYTKLINTYLNRYKKIDSTMKFLESSLMYYNKRKYPKITMGWIRSIYRKYKRLGYKDITIDYEELWRVCRLK